MRSRTARARVAKNRAKHTEKEAAPQRGVPGGRGQGGKIPLTAESLEQLVNDFSRIEGIKPSFPADWRICDCNFQKRLRESDLRLLSTTISNSKRVQSLALRHSCFVSPESSWDEQQEGLRKGVSALVPSLTAAESSLETLALCGTLGGPALCLAVEELVRCTSKLRVLDVCALDARGRAHGLFRAVAACASLREFMYEDELDYRDTEDVAAFARMIRDSKTLRIVRADNGLLPGATARAIFEALALNKSLLTLSLSNMFMGDTLPDPDSAPVVCPMHSTARHSICHNDEFEIRHSGVGTSRITSAMPDLSVRAASHLLAGLADAMATNKSLQKIDLSYNFLDSGAGKIARILYNNNTLRSVDISRCSFRKSSRAAILRALKSNTSLHTLNLGR